MQYAKIINNPRMDIGHRSHFVVDVHIELQNGQRQHFFGYGDSLRQCWLDMFASFKAEYPTVFVTNGKLRDHIVRKTF